MSKSIAFMEQPRVKGTKASDDVVTADMVCVGVRILGLVSMTGAM